jgi:hypothetical protein
MYEYCFRAFALEVAKRLEPKGVGMGVFSKVCEDILPEMRKKFPEIVKIHIKTDQSGLSFTIDIKDE